MVARSGQSPSDIPPAPAPRDRLPRYSLPLVGREREATDLRALLLVERAPVPAIVTLTGPAGVGKTRLAVRVASMLSDHLADGAIFVPLAATLTDDLVLPTIDAALAAAGFSALGDDAAARVIAALEARSLLVVLDNAEQLPGIGAIVTELAGRLPHVRWLVTSCSPIHVEAEIVYPLAPLTPPAEDDPTASFPAVDLFLARARQANADMVATPSSLAAVRAICRRLGGLPLALELAAARVRTLSPEEMVRILQRAMGALDLLEGDARDQAPRHQSIREAIAWSYSLLTPSAQRLFRRLGVVSADVSLATIEQIGEGDGLLRDLEALVESSLVRHQIAEEGTSRYDMLQPVREFAHAQLIATGELADAQRALIAWARGFAQERGSAFQTTELTRWIASLATEIGTIRAAIVAAITLRDAESALEIISFTLWQYWGIRGVLRDEGGVIEEIMTIAEAEPDRVALGLRATGHAALATRAYLQGELERAAEAYARALALGRQSGDDTRLLNSLNNLGLVLRELGRPDEAKVHLEESLSIRRALGMTRALVPALMNLGDLALQQDDLPTAKQRFSEALAVAEEDGGYLQVGYALMNLGDVALREGQLGEAQSMAEQGLALVRYVGEQRGIVQAQLIVARAALARGAEADALGALQEVVTLTVAASDRVYLALALDVLAEVLVRGGDDSAAILMLGAAFRVRREAGVSTPAAVEARIASLRRAHPGGDFLIPWGDGQQLAGERLQATIAELVTARTATTMAAVGASDAVRSVLTERERDVMRLLIDGKSDREIAEALFISHRTASNHVARILDKLGVRSRTAAASMALRLGMVG